MTKYFEEGKKSYSNTYTTFHAISDKPRRVSTFNGEPVGDFPFAELMVRKPTERPLFDTHLYYLDIDLPDYSARTLGDRMRRDGHDEDEIRKAVEEQRNTPQMFVSRPAEVVGLYADPSMRHTVGTLGGLAINQFGKLRADHTLSQYSSRLAKRGIDSGVVEGDPDNSSAEPNINTSLSPRERGYDVESATNHTLVPPDYFSEISKPQLDHARRTVHGILRPKTSPEQFGPFLPDPQLPGMEGY
jgi:hypothetical protein